MCADIEVLNKCRSLEPDSALDVMFTGSDAAHLKSQVQSRNGSGLRFGQHRKPTSLF
jgi:hypothetical protein